MTAMRLFQNEKSSGKPINYNFVDDFAGLKTGQQLGYFGVVRGQNCLVTGGGGVGKSHLIGFLEKYINGLVLTATTGIAGVNINACTFASFMGFNQECQTMEDAKKRPNDDIVERIQAAKVLLIDEASMLRIDQFENADARCRAIKGVNKPFGGLQVLLFCDLMQLGPVVSKKTKEGEIFLEKYGKKTYFFESPIYKQANFVPYLLDEYVRNGDVNQRKVLRSMRMGRNLDQVVSYINEKATGTRTTAGSIYICKTNQRVREINELAFSKLTGASKSYKAVQEGRYSPESRVVNATLDLRMGARVMLTVNDPNKTFFNGELGSVIGLYDEHVVVSLDRGKTVTVERYTWNEIEYVTEKNPDGTPNLVRAIAGTFAQFPLRLGYAITAHKSQGLTLDSADIDLSGRFNATGLAYVVISRVRDFSGLRLLHPLKVSDIQTSKIAADFTYEQSMAALARRDEDLAFLRQCGSMLKKAA